MKSRIALADKNSPATFGLQLPLLAWLALDHFRAPEWAWGVTFTVVGLCMIGWAIDFFRCREIDLGELEKRMSELERLYGTRVQRRSDELRPDFRLTYGC